MRGSATLMASRPQIIGITKGKPPWRAGLVSPSVVTVRNPPVYRPHVIGITAVEDHHGKVNPFRVFARNFPLRNF